MGIDVVSTLRLPKEAREVLAGWRVEEPSDRTGTREWFTEMLSRGGRVAIVGFLRVDSEVLASGRELEIVIATSSGVDHIDVKAAEDMGICVANQPEAIAEAVSEHALAGILSALRNIVTGHNYVVSGEWERRGWPRHFRGGLIIGRTLGLLGMGRIATSLAFKARALGVHRILYWSRTRKPGLEQALGAEFRPLEDVFRESDIVVNTLPYTPETKGIVKAEHIAAMPKRGIFVNVGRGGTVDEAALEYAIRERPDIALVLDVFSEEPLPADSSLVKAAIDGGRVILTPHIAGYSVESGILTRILAAMQARTYLIEGTVWNPVNAACRKSVRGPPRLEDLLASYIKRS